MKPILWTLAAAMIAAFALASPASAQDNNAPELLVAPQPQPQPQEAVRLAPLSEQFVPQVAAPKQLTMVNYIAMQRAAERRARLEAQAWYGVSNLRPNVPAVLYPEYAAPYANVVYSPYQWPSNYGVPMMTFHSAH